MIKEKPESEMICPLTTQAKTKNSRGIFLLPSWHTHGRQNDDHLKNGKIIQFQLEIKVA